MPTVKCRHCQSSFYAKPSWVRYGNAKYCSRECQYEGRKNGKLTNCFICKKESYKTQKQLRVSKSKKYFCGKSCQTIWRNNEFRGSKHANWKEGKHVDYRAIMARYQIKPRCKLCSLKDIRVLAVHHRNRDRKNNNISNLVWLCYNCHRLAHQYNVAIA